MYMPAVQCPTLSNPTNGAVSCSSRNYGDVASYSCNTGYNLNGYSTRTCQSSGSWSYSAPTCGVVQCPTLSNPTNGAVSYSSRNYGDVASYSCNTGYNLNGYSTRTCQSSGSWSYSAPTCVVVQCPILSSPTNGAVSGSNSYGDVLTFTCIPGYTLAGASSLTCRADGTWSASPPTCELGQCPVLTAPTNGVVSGSNSYGDVVTFTCNTGYNLVGSSTLTCLSSLAWSGNPPTCASVQCPALQSPTNGGSSGSNYYQDVMSFTCDSGYQLDGSATITCQADRIWTDSAPTCPPVQCPLLAAPDNGEKSGENYYQDVLTFWCHPGYELVGPSSMTCQADRTWSDNVPTCARVQCPALQSPTNGGSSGSNYYQDVMSFTCDSGYELDGSAAITCQADRTWTDSAPSCPRKNR
ncbi:P-selectin-like [Branchiostoma floridae]|uniref:P-selectin-like n=1 Tax=Branchiostoma floridae TaxID=7739 RepID=A0A9J7K9W9_BRAFL|nr:P-selectin-like [Branchiostoma floridae]